MSLDKKCGVSFDKKCGVSLDNWVEFRQKLGRVKTKTVVSLNKNRDEFRQKYGSV